MDSIFKLDSVGKREILRSLRDNFDHATIAPFKDDLIVLMKDEDPKVRRLAHTLVAMLKDEKDLELLLNAYLQETTQMLRGDMCKNLMRYFDLSLHKDALMAREQELLKLDGLDKHQSDEIHVLRQILKDQRATLNHTFTGFKQPTAMILVMPAGHQDALLNMLPASLEAKKVGIGVRVKTNDLKTLYQNHCFTHIYIPVTSLKDVNLLAEEKLAKSIVAYLNNCHKENHPYRFYIDSKEDRHKLAAQLENSSKGMLQNYPGDYEVIFHLRETKTGDTLVYLEIMTMKDPRFKAYKETSSSALNSKTAALISYYVGGASHVLDPMCNDGTLLLEYTTMHDTKEAMGLNPNPRLMKMCDANILSHKSDVQTALRDFANYDRPDGYELILTQLPSLLKNKKDNDVKDIYEMIFKKGIDLMPSHGVLAIYSTEEKLIKDMASRYRRFYIPRKIYPILGKANLFIYEMVK